MEAFEIKRRTLYQWRKQLREGNHNLESLNEKSRAPRKRRKRLWPKEVIEEIRRLRSDYPNLGKEKLYPFIKSFCDQRKQSCPKPKPSGESSPISPIRCAAAQLNSDPKGNESREKRLLRAENPKVIKQPVLENAVPLTP